MAASTYHHLLRFRLLTILLLLSSSASSSSSSSSSFSNYGLTRGSSLLVENKDEVMVSPNGRFTAGFHRAGENAYVFAVWFTETRTVVWMANRDAPVNGKLSKLSLWKDGNLVLIDAGQYVTWSTQTGPTSSSVQLKLLDTGNLVLQQVDTQHNTMNTTNTKTTLWQSFDYPTDTLLPNQPFTKNTQLVSSRSSTNYSSGFYKLFFDDDSILRLVYNSPETTSLYWPDPRLPTYVAGRFQYIDSRNAILDSLGQFNSSDGFSFASADYGIERQRMIRIDYDGNVRLYSLVRGTKWEIQWQAISHTCRIDGACGPNSLCTYSSNSGRKCSCLYGYKMVDSQDWSLGCEPEFDRCKKADECDFIRLAYTEFYGYDIRFHPNATLAGCKQDCLQDTTCIGFNFARKQNAVKFDPREDSGHFFCFLKSSLRNGYQTGVYGTMFVKLPKRLASSFNEQIVVGQSSFSCPRPVVTPQRRSYEKITSTKPIGFMLVVGCTIGSIEIICILFFWYCSSRHPSTSDQAYFPASTGFRKFTYSELKKASGNFSEEIGRGGGSIVYKARLNDNRVAAIKKLINNSNGEFQGQGEDEFQAEISTIGRMNHMNLIETWGYCAEGKHMLVVYEYMENGSLAENLENLDLDWATRIDIAVGAAKGLAYLHEECLEWVLHCDVKPHNILLDGEYNAKVADFGMSKWSDRGGNGVEEWNFSMMRGTRGYMAPEWVLNLPITSKVDVFSYGVVLLEMITGRSPANKCEGNGEGLINWVRDWVQTDESWVEKIVDPDVRGEYDVMMMENLVRIGLQCTEEDKVARPTMSQVVNMLLQLY